MIGARLKPPLWKDGDMDLNQVWTILNSPQAVVLVAGAVLWGLNRIYSKKPLWEQFEGTIIAGIKFAEKKIPADTENKGAAKLDAALKYIVSVYEEVRGKSPSRKVLNELTEGVKKTHAVLEAAGNLKK